MQETKLADAEAPVAAFRDAGYELAHHGEGRWNGVAIASRCGLESVVTNFGEPLGRAGAEEGDSDPLAEARMISAVCGGVRVVCLYAPNGRVVGSAFYVAKLGWFDRLSRWLEASTGPGDALVLGGDLNVAPADIDVWDPRACHGGTHVSAPEREAFARLCRLGARRRLPAASPGAGPLHVVGLPRRALPQELRHAHRPPARDAPLAARTVSAEIDREARKGKPIPSDHAPLVIDVDAAGCPFDAGWAQAEGRIALRRGGRA